MYGGRIETHEGNVTDELWIFNIQSQSWSTKTPMVLGHGQRYAVEGHSAHIMELDSRDAVMVIIFGYSAVYGYTSSVQEYHICELLRTRNYGLFSLLVENIFTFHKICTVNLVKMVSCLK